MFKLSVYFEHFSNFCFSYFLCSFVSRYFCSMLSLPLFSAFLRLSSRPALPDQPQTAAEPFRSVRQPWAYQKLVRAAAIKVLDNSRWFEGIRYLAFRSSDFIRRFLQAIPWKPIPKFRCPPRAFRTPHMQLSREMLPIICLFFALLAILAASQSPSYIMFPIFKFSKF